MGYNDVQQQISAWEGHRLYPPVSPMVALQREATCDAVVGGSSLREGDKLWINVMGIHHDPKFWPDPKVPPPPPLSLLSMPPFIPGPPFPLSSLLAWHAECIIKACASCRSSEPNAAQQSVFRSIQVHLANRLTLGMFYGCAVTLRGQNTLQAFKPERIIEGRKEAQGQHPYAYLPFGD